MLNLTIKQKLMFLAGIMIVSFLVIGAIYHYGVSVQHEADNEKDRITNVDYLVEEINSGLLQARRYEKDFLLRNELQYSERHRKTMEENLSLLSNLQGLVKDPQISHNIERLNEFFSEYQQGFDNLVEIKLKVGLNEEMGLLGNLRKSVHDVEHTLKQHKTDKLTVSMLMMRRHEKDYLAREKDKYIDKMTKQQTIFSGLLEKSEFPETVKRKISNEIASYYRDFIALTDGMKRTHTEIATMRESSNKIDPILSVIHEKMESLSNNNRDEYRATEKRIVSMMTATLVIVGLIVAAIVWLLSQGIVASITASVKSAENISQGDLTTSIVASSNDEMGRLQQAMRNMADRLQEIVREVRESSNSVLKATGEITSGNMELSQRTEEQASSLEETASSMEEMTTTVKESADNALRANKLASGTREEARKGGHVVEEAVSAMNDIRDSSKKITDIINVVEDIAFQTNLLALNAAVEAARAGEQGRGFAVVASEVRTLAGRSAESAKQIRTLIEDSVDKVQSGAELVNESGERLYKIVESVTKLTDIVSEMAAASQEQAAGIDQVNKAVLQMDQMTQQNSALVEEAASASRALQDQALQLNQVIGFFKVGDGNLKETSVNLAEMYTQKNIQSKHASTHHTSSSISKNNLNSDKSSKIQDSSENQTNTSSMRKTGTYDEEWSEF
jgi:methyl-accepting chemotaxis protein